MFLDSEAKFKIHNLKQIVAHTEAFVFILTHGILLSVWCMEELKSALENKKKVQKKTFFGDHQNQLFCIEIRPFLA